MTRGFCLEGKAVEAPAGVAVPVENDGVRGLCPRDAYRGFAVWGYALGRLGNAADGKKGFRALTGLVGVQSPGAVITCFRKRL